MPNKILDIGCGNGDAVFLLSKKGANVVGIDLDVSEAIKKYPGLKFHSMSAEKLCFENDSFDEVHAHDVLEHVATPDAMLDETFRVLRPGGRAIITVPHYRSEKILLQKNKTYWQEVGHRRLFEKGELEKLVTGHGFTIVRQEQKSFFIFVTLWIMFRLGRHINSQKGDFEPTLLYKLLQIKNQFFDAEITFQTKAKYIPLWIVTLPVAWVFNKIIPKTVKIEARKLFV